MRAQKGENPLSAFGRYFFLDRYMGRKGSVKLHQLKSMYFLNSCSKFGKNLPSGSRRGLFGCSDNDNGGVVTTFLGLKIDPS